MTYFYFYLTFIASGLTLKLGWFGIQYWLLKSAYHKVEKDAKEYLDRFYNDSNNTLNTIIKSKSDNLH